MEAAHKGEVIRREPGPGIADERWAPVPAASLWHDGAVGRTAGLRADYHNGAAAEGTPAASRVEETVDFRWTFNRPARGISTDWFAVRLSGGITMPAGAARALAVEGDDGYRLWVDDSLVIDADLKVSYSRRATTHPLAAGDHRIRIEYRKTTGNGRLRLLMDDRGAAARGRSRSASSRYRARR
jgi:beta-glucosidase